MDLQMPEMGGLDAIIAIRNEFPDARIIVLTTYAGDAQALRAIRAGARGYLLKNAPHTEVLDTIRAVHAGRKAMFGRFRSSLPNTPPTTHLRPPRSVCCISSHRVRRIRRLRHTFRSARRR